MRGEDGFSGQIGNIVKVATIRPHRIVHRQRVALPHRIVVWTMRRRDVNEAGAGAGGHEIGQDHRHFARLERMTQSHALQRGARTIGQHAMGLDAPAGQNGIDLRLGQDKALATLSTLHFDQHIIQLGMHRHRLIGRQRPGRGGPDDDRNRAVALALGRVLQPGKQHFGLRAGKAHVDGERLMLGVFHLGLGQGRAAINAPVHRLGPALQMAVGDDLRQSPHDVGFIGRVHGEVGMLPVGQHAQTDEILALAGHLGLGISPTGPAEIPRSIHARLALRLFHGQFDR